MLVPEGNDLRVASIFDMIQGEGPLVGVPATFIRLQGCNVRCPGCDTDYDIGTKMSVLSILEQLSRMPHRTVAVVTGGEPFLQDVTDLVAGLQEGGWYVLIETNGTLWPGERFFETVDLKRLMIVCSPKNEDVDLRLWKYIAALKYVVTCGEIDQQDGLPLRTLGCDGKPARPPDWWSGEVYVQPADVGSREQNRLNLQAAVASCLKHNYRLSLQTHKLIWRRTPPRLRANRPPRW